MKRLCLRISLCLTLMSSWQLGNSALLFTTNSEFGIFMAISVPISLPHYNVFVSYNYEFNYYLPEHVYKYPPILMGDFEDSYLTYSTITSRDCENCTASDRLASNSTDSGTTTGKQMRKRAVKSLVTRNSFYMMLRDKLTRSGYPGEACLLRLICETNASTLGDINGFLGTLVHIIFTPTSSQDEHLPPEYYQAEQHGRNEQCESYESACAENVLDLISVPMHEIVNNVVSRRL